MGYMRHNAIIVTGFDEAKVNAWHAEAVAIFGGAVTNIVKAEINGYWSFLVGPDGSKEGWAESDEGDERRARFLAYLGGQQWPDWIEVQYGDDNGENVATNASTN